MFGASGGPRRQGVALEAFKFALYLAVPISLTFFVAFNPTMLDKVIKNVCMFSMNSFLLSLALSRSLSLNKKSERKNERIFGH